MEAALKKLKSSTDTELPAAKCTNKEVLTELREMNAKNVEFYDALIKEINLLKSDGRTDNTQLEKLEDSLNVHKTETEGKVAGFETRLNALSDENVVLREDISSLKTENEVLKEKTLELECRSRKRNLIIGNIAEKPGLNSKETYDEISAKVVKLFSDKLGIMGANMMLFRNIHRLGQRSPQHTKPRNVIVAFLIQPDVDKVLQAARDIKDPTVSIRTDLPAEYNEIRNALLKIRADYRRLPTQVKCKLAYKKFKPVLYKEVPGQPDVIVKIEKGLDNKYIEILET